MPHRQPVLAVECEDGHRFELIHVPSPQPRRRLLMLPGMGLTARQYIAFAQALAHHGTEVWVHEWRGLGSSSVRASRLSNWGYQTLLEVDLQASLAALAADHDQPLFLAGHSLGSQFACLLAARHPDQCRGIAVIAGGAPYWRRFPLWMQAVLIPAFTFMPLVAGLVGHYPGYRLGFAGRESRDVIGDWARTGRTGHYHAPGFSQDMEAAMQTLTHPVLGLRLADDWFVPETSLQFLLDKLPSAQTDTVVVAGRNGNKADHYSWLKEPAGAAEALNDWLTGYTLDKAAANSRA